MEEGASDLAPGLRGRPRISCEEGPTALPLHACSPCLKHHSTHHASLILISSFYKFMTANNKNDPTRVKRNWLIPVEIDCNDSTAAQLAEYIDSYHHHFLYAVTAPKEINCDAAATVSLVI